MTALAALFAGLYYDSVALDEAYELAKDWNAAAREALRADVPTQGLAAQINGRSVREIARDTLAIAGRGLVRRARRNAAGEDETIHLAPLHAIVDAGKSLAQHRLDTYNEKWRGSIDRAFSDCLMTM
jgi:glutamate--cysteine ligase